MVIDLDLRKPKVHHGFGTENVLGMSNLISGISTLEEVIQHSDIPNLDFITAGPIPPNPSELIQSKEKRWNNKWDTFFTHNDTLKEAYGTVICNVLKNYIDSRDLIYL